MVNYLPFLVPLIFPLIAVAAGAISGRAERRYRVQLIVGALLAWVVWGVLAATTHVAGVSVTDLVVGSVGAGVMLGAVPVCVYFGVGRALGRHPVVLSLVCAASVVPLGYYFFAVMLFTADLTACPPDAYECPV